MVEVGNFWDFPTALPLSAQLPLTLAPLKGQCSAALSNLYLTF